METVDCSRQRGPMLLGIGTLRQRSALLKEGVEKFIAPTDFEYLFDPDIVYVVFRPGDTVIMAQPSLLTEKQTRMIAARSVAFQVIGHEPRKLSGDEDVREFRRLRAKVAKDVVRDGRGAKPRYPVPSAQQIRTMVSLWRSDLKRSEVVKQAQVLMDAEVPVHWVRDQVIKATGTAARKPDA